MQEAAKAARHRLPTAVVGSNEGNTKALLRALYDLGEHLKEEYDWPHLTRKAVVALTDGVSRYNLPADFDTMLPSTLWNQATDFCVSGPVTPQRFQATEEGSLGSSVWQEIHIRGHDTTQLYVHPTPGSGAGTITYLYQSSSWIRPDVWAVNKSFATNDYCYHEGNIYRATNTATTGGTPPTHTTGTISDGGVAWIFADINYSEALKDSDVVVFDASLMIHGVTSKFLEQGGFDNSTQEARFQQRLNRVKPRLGGAPDLYNSCGPLGFRGQFSIPDGSWSMP